MLCLWTRTQMSLKWTNYKTTKQTVRSQRPKPIFATYRVHTQLITNNRPSYVSHKLAEFARKWGFHHVTTSPHHSQASSKAESAVRIIEGLIKKTQREGGDIWRAILQWRNTLMPGTESSPTQRVMSCRTRSFLPCKTALYQAKVQETVIAPSGQQAKKYFNQSAGPLLDLMIGQNRCKGHSCLVDTWEKIAPRSFQVDLNSRNYQNIIHFCDTIDTSSHHTASPP